MKKRISKNIFDFSNLIIELKNEKRKKYFLNLFWFKTDFKKQKSKFLSSFFDFKSKNELQKILSFFNFRFQIEKWKMRNFQNSFCFLIKKRIILSVHGLVRFSLFILMKKLKNELLKQIKINFMIIITSIVYTLFKSQFVSSPPKVFRCAMVTRTPRIRFLKNSWCILMFTLLAATFIFGSFS